MLFNSWEFLFLFLPFSVGLFLLAAKAKNNEAAIAVLVLCSLFFYSWWNPVYLLLLVFSMIVNYQIGKKLGNERNKALLVSGVAINLALIAYYKYAGFVVFNFNLVSDVSWDLGEIVLPLAISFFTFQQIAYLVDSYRGITKEYKFLHYALFVSFFPQLIAGPIVHHRDMLPQFERKSRFRLKPEDVAIGLSIFSIGLFKKTVLADGVAVYANPVFSVVDAGGTVDLFAAWGGALAYTFQLYFDFSGYSDMAVGLARIFGIVLPLNFYSPYKSANISEFWRRWHMTLSEFLRDYVYISLGGNQRGQLRRYVNLFSTMLLGGLWHGAGWNFVIWGALHGFYLCINHGWQRLMRSVGFNGIESTSYGFAAWVVTFVAVVFGWVFFRAVTLDGAVSLSQSMLGIHGISMPNGVLVRLGELGVFLQNMGISSIHGGGENFMFTWLWNLSLLACVVALPNVQDLFCKVGGSLSKWSYKADNSFWPARSFWGEFGWEQSTSWALIISFSLMLGILTLSQVSEFLYFQF